MSDRIHQPYQGVGVGGSGQYQQSVSMSHWTSRSHRTPSQSINQSSSPFVNQVGNNSIKQTYLMSRARSESESSRSAKRFKDDMVRTTETVCQNEQRNYQNYPNHQNSSWAQFQKQKYLAGIPNVPSTNQKVLLTSGIEMTMKDFHNKMPQYGYDVEATYSKTTHSVVITKKTDVSLCKENQVFKEPRVSDRRTMNTQGQKQVFKEPRVLTQGTGNPRGKSPVFSEPGVLSHGNTRGHRYSLTPLGQAGVDLQTTFSSTASYSEEDNLLFETFEGQNNLPLTDVMEKGKTHLGGAYASTNKKIVAAEPVVSPRAVVCTTKIPDINLKIPAMDYTGESTSKTQSLDIELFHAANLINPESKHSESSVRPDPYSIWIKRLTSNSGAKRSFELASIINTELTLWTAGSKKEEAITLSHPWIQRWCHKRNVAQQKKQKTDGCCSQWPPSLAAMALMGRAMNGFPQCEFQKRGSVVVWKTRRHPSIE